MYSGSTFVDRGALLLVPVLDLGLDVLEDGVLVARALVLGELHLIDLGLALLLGGEEERLADGVRAPSRDGDRCCASSSPGTPR